MSGRARAEAWEVNEDTKAGLYIFKHISYVISTTLVPFGLFTITNEVSEQQNLPPTSPFFFIRHHLELFHLYLVRDDAK